MDIKDIISDLIEKFASGFLQETAKYKDFQLSDRIYCNFWKQDISKALAGHDFESFNLSFANLANWFVRYAHALCEDPKKNHARDSLKLSNPLGLFPPRSSLLHALGHNTSPKKQLIKTCEEISHTKNWKLNADNFIENFKFLIEMEDVEILLEYMNIRQYDVELKQTAPLRLRGQLNQNNIKSNGCARNLIDVVAPKIDEAVIIPKNLQFPVNAKINTCCLEMLLPNDIKLLKLPVRMVNDISETEVILESLPNKSWSKTVDIVFRPTRSTIRYQHRSLTLLAKNKGMRQFLYPDSGVRDAKQTPINGLNEKRLTKQQLINTEIFYNNEQLAAVSQITFGQITSNAPFIIFGPPGTGKTTTVVESILQLRLQQPDSRILVTAGSNSACDTIALRICEYFESIPAELAENATAWPLLRIYSKSIVERGLQNLHPELRRQSNIDWLNGLHAYPAIEDIQRYGIIVATLSTVGKLVCGNVSENNFFTHVFIDEAGAASEPETLVGIMGIKNRIDDKCFVILSGDHKQLGPVIKSNQAVRYGLGKSLMQRLLERECYAVKRNGAYDTSLQIRLRLNYRSHPEIVGLFNRLYYGQELIAKAAQNVTFDKKWSFLRNANFPIAFHAVHGEMSKNGSTSSCNMLEIQVLFNYVSLLLKADRVVQNDIGIITPYKLQSECIKKRLNEHNWRNIEVGSVEYFQGREKPIIIASMVRSKDGLGFVRNRKRLNVLLSRPKVLLLILGEPKTLSQFYDLKFIIETCKRRGNYYDETNNTFGQIEVVAPSSSTDLAQSKVTQKKKPKTKKKSRKHAKKAYSKALVEATTNITPRKQNSVDALTPKNSNKQSNKSKKTLRKFFIKRQNLKKSLKSTEIDQSVNSETSKENSNVAASPNSKGSKKQESPSIKASLNETKAKPIKI